MFGQIALRAGGERSVGWLATAVVDAHAPRHELDRMTASARAAGLSGTMIISRDVLPLLVAPPLRGRGVAVVCGTGSGFIASDGVMEPLSVGGCEYLGSDEGSAFAIGLDGLRAAVRASDGRGAPTALRAAFARLGGGTVQDLARALATQPYPKAAVAALSTVVTGCWQDGDAVAGDVVRTAVDDLVVAVRAARDRAGLTHDWTAALAGGVFRNCAPFAQAVSRRIVADLGADSDPVPIDDPVTAVMRALRDNTDGLADVLEGRWAWTRTLNGAGG
jgi:N-acetylglucosamine kinase-like BadF-type ATPase